MPKAISITINTDDVLKAADLEGFAVSPAEASRWLRENAWAIEEFAHDGLYEFMAKVMRTDFPEETLRRIENGVDSALMDALEARSAGRKLTLQAYSIDGDLLSVTRRFRNNLNATAVLDLEVNWKGAPPAAPTMRVEKRGETYTAELKRPRGFTAGRGKREERSPLRRFTGTLGPEDAICLHDSRSPRAMNDPIRSETAVCILSSVGNARPESSAARVCLVPSFSP